MSDDEIMMLVVSLVGAGLFAFQWFARFVTAPVGPRPRWFGWLNWLPVLLLVALFGVLVTIASFDVRAAPPYLLLYTAMGWAWLLAAMRVLASFGISFRDDAIERRNAAAAILVACAMTANGAIFIGANIGDGPGWWCVVLAGGSGAVAWFVLWGVVEMMCGASEQITVERDTGAAIRLGGYMLASGLVLARGAAGDWTSLPQTIADFWVAWPALVLTAAAIGVEKTRGGPTSNTTSLLIAAFYIAVGVAAVALSPPLPQNPTYGGQ